MPTARAATSTVAVDSMDPLAGFMDPRAASMVRPGAPIPALSAALIMVASQETSRLVGDRASVGAFTAEAFMVVAEAFMAAAEAFMAAVTGNRLHLQTIN